MTSISVMNSRFDSVVVAARSRRAMTLLETTELPVSEVAARSGFGQAHGFSRAFRRATGMTASAYRRS